MKHFAPQYDTVRSFVSKKIGTFTESISTRPAFFGPSAFIDLIHTLQLDITGADISFAAPLSFDAEIKEGDVSVSDMFNLYKYENMLYVMTLSGKEIKDFLGDVLLYVDESDEVTGRSSALVQEKLAMVRRTGPLSRISVLTLIRLPALFIRWMLLNHKERRLRLPVWRMALLSL